MNNLFLPNRHVMRLEMQPGFPTEDLTKDNAQVLAGILKGEAGLEAQVCVRENQQHYIYQIAVRAAKLLDMNAWSSPEDGLRAFSAGLVAVETISDLVHPVIHSNDKKVIVLAEPLFVDTRSALDVEAERLIFGPAELAGRLELLDYEPREILTSKEVRTDEQTATADAKTIAEAKARAEARAKERARNNDTSGDKGEAKDVIPFPLRTTTFTPAMEDALRHIPTVEAATNTVDQPDPEKVLMDCYGILPGQLPNTFDVIVALSRVHSDSEAQLRMRLAGAGLALLLKTRS